MINKELLNSAESPNSDGDFSSKINALRSFKKEDTKQKATLNQHLEQIIDELKEHALGGVDENFIINIVHERLEEKVGEGKTRLQDKIEHAVGTKLQEQGNTVKQYAYMSNYEQLLDIKGDGSMANPYVITKGKNFYRKMPEELSGKLISTNSNNSLKLGTDNRLYVDSEAKTVKYDHGKYKDVQTALDKAFEHGGSVIVNRQFNNGIEVIKGKLGLGGILERDTEIMLDRNEFVFEANKDRHVVITEDGCVAVDDGHVILTISNKGFEHTGGSALSFGKTITYKADAHIFDGDVAFEEFSANSIESTNIRTENLTMKGKEGLLGINSKGQVVSMNPPIQVKGGSLVGHPVVTFAGGGKAVRTKHTEKDGTITTHTEIYAGKTLYVDDIYGSDETGKRERRDKPFKTINKAIQSSKDGDTIQVIHYEGELNAEINHDLTIKGKVKSTGGELHIKECNIDMEFVALSATLYTENATLNLKGKVISNTNNSCIYSYGKNTIDITTKKIIMEDAPFIDLGESIGDTIVVSTTIGTFEGSSQLIGQSKLAKGESYLHTITINAGQIGNAVYGEERVPCIELDVSDTKLFLNIDHWYMQDRLGLSIVGGNNRIYINSREARLQKLLWSDSHETYIDIDKGWFTDGCIDIEYGGLVEFDGCEIDVTGGKIIEARESSIIVKNSSLLREGEKDSAIDIGDSLITFRGQNIITNENENGDTIISHEKSECKIYGMVYTNPEYFGIDVDDDKVDPSFIR